MGTKAAQDAGEGTKGIARKLPSRSGVGSSTKGKPEGAYTVADALIAAGVCNESWDGRTINEAQVRDQRNRDRTLERVAGMKGGPLLESRGWVKDGHWWYPTR